MDSYVCAVAQEDVASRVALPRRRTARARVEVDDEHELETALLRDAGTLFDV